MGMYVGLSYARRGVAVWAWSGAHVSETEWAQHLRDVRAVRDWGHLAPTRPSVLIHLVDDLFIPGATQRRELAQESAHPDYRPNLAVVTRNMAVRGVMRALTWLQSAQPYQIEPFGDVAAGVQWLERERGHPLPELQTLLERAHAELGRPTEES